MHVNYTKYDIYCHQFFLICSIVIVNRDIVSPTLNVNPTLFVIPCVFLGGNIDLQCCSYYHLSSDFSFKFKSSMTIFHHKLLPREDRVLANE